MAEPAAVIVHDLAQLRAAFAAARALEAPLLARTAPGAAGYAGVLYLRKAVAAAAAEVGAAPARVVIDCGDDAGVALAALRAGWSDIAFSGRAEVRDKIADIAAQAGARLVDLGGGAALDLATVADPERACRAWLGEGGARRG